MTLLNNPYVFWGVLIFANILMYLLNILISYCWSHFYKTSTLKITKPDIKTSIYVLFANILVAFPGYFLFLTSKIVFTETHFFRDLILLIMGFDLLMYFIHYLSHTVWPFKMFHKNHHSHKDFNVISLYVMHPFEAFSFGALLTIFALLFDLNFYSFMVFLFFNWLYGVVAHLNTESTKQPFIFGNHIFHKAHHKHSNCNYGFYTVFWDWVFRTGYKKN